MKTLNKLFITGIVLLFIITSFNNVNAQDSTATETKKENAIEQLINAKNFVFVPQTVVPSTGRIRQLNSYYEVSLNTDTLISFLPYFGRVYAASIGATKSVLDFNSTKFEYNVAARKKGGWEVTLNLKDQMDVRQFAFTVFDNGTASLRVNNNNAQPISFDGYVTAPKQHKEK